MRLLLDTHAFLWWLAGDKRMTSRARAAIVDEANDVYVSAASAWEVATKVRLGKLQGGEFIAQEFGEHLALQGFIGLDITVEHGQRAGNLSGPHVDLIDETRFAADTPRARL
jgi:PIN domain nuclease of toxin-antitoxin system